MEWMSYPQKDGDDINANLSTGPVELVFGQNKFKVGLVQRSPRNGCTRPVRMMKDGTFEVDLANRCVYPIADYRVPIWTPYSENSNRAIHFRLAKRQHKDLTENAENVTENGLPFTVGLMQVGMTGTGKWYTRNVRMTTVNVPGLPSRTGPTDAVDNTERVDQSTPSTMTSEPQLYDHDGDHNHDDDSSVSHEMCDLKKQIKESQTIVFGSR